MLEIENLAFAYDDERGKPLPKVRGYGDSQKNITFAQSKSEFNDNKMK